MPISIRSLCSGFGGLDVAVEDVTGGTVVDHAEIDPHAAAVHARHWPGIPNLGDLTAIDWAALDPTDILCAGYPCQPFSTAGKRQGANDARHLWPHIAEAIRVLRPGLVVLENVAGHLSLGFGAVLGDLAACGYVGSWRRLRASDIGACHRRDRVFVVASPADADRQGLEGRAALRSGRGERPAGPGGLALLPDGTELEYVVDWAEYEPAIRRHERVFGRRAPAPTDQRGRLNPPFVEWMLGLERGWVTDTLGPSRSVQLRILGNGVVSQQATAALSTLLAPMKAAA